MARRLRGMNRDAALGVAMLTVVAAVLVFGLSGVLAGLVSGGEETRTVRAVFRDGQQLRGGEEVRIQGVVAGKVASIGLNDGGRDATVTMDVDEKAGPLHRDARAVLRWKTVLGGSFYVDLERGSPAAGDLSGPIPVQRTARQTEVEDVVSVVQGRAVKGLQTLPRELADALEDERAPARLLKTVDDIAPAVRGGLNALRGEELDSDLRVLVKETARTVRALGRPAGDLRTVVSGAATTLRTVAARDREVRRALADGPGTEAGMRRTLGRLHTTLDLADPLLRDLREPAGDVAPTLAALRPGVVDGARLVRRALPLLRALRPAAHDLAGVARRGLPFVKDLEPSLDRAERTILPYINEVDPQTKHSTAVMIGGGFSGLAGPAGQMDENGHFVRFPAALGSSPVNSLPCQVYINNPDAAQIVACNTLQQALGTYLSYSPLGPTPGTDPGEGGG